MSDQVAEIKSKVDIAQLIGERIQLKQRGRRFLALCPFHSEKTPSFTVSPELGIFKCFGCGAAGDAFTFLERYEGMSFVEGLEYLADRVGVKLERRAVDARIAALDRQIFEVNHLAAEYFHFLLTKHRIGEKARAYLAKRKVSHASIGQYFIGYAPARWDSLLTFLIKKGYTAELLEKAGLVIARKKEEGKRKKEIDTSDISSLYPSSLILLPSDCYDRFRGRIMFPLRDARGQIIGFAGRMIPSPAFGGINSVEGPDTTQAKYINSPETPVYQKGKHLFGIFENKDEIRKEDRVILVEGELDAISSWQAGVRNIVAVKGTAVTSDQVKLLRRYTRNVTVAMDTDEAGWDALVRSLPILESYGMNIRVVVMPGGAKDPDDMARQDPGGWRELVARAANVYDALISGTIARIGIETGEQKKRASEILIPVLIGVANIVEQDHWIKEVSRRFGVREESVRRQMEVSRSGARQGMRDEGPDFAKAPTGRQGLMGAEIKKTKSEVLSQYLLALLIQSGGPIPSELKLEWLSPVGAQKILAKLASSKKTTENIRGLRDSLPEELHELFDEAALLSIGTNKDILGDNLVIDQEIRRVLRGLEQAWIKHELSRSRADPEKARALAKRMQELQAAEG